MIVPMCERPQLLFERSDILAIAGCMLYKSVSGHMGMCEGIHFSLPAIPDSNCFELKHVKGLFRPCIAIHR